jgi:hypothetical protein
MSITLLFEYVGEVIDMGSTDTHAQTNQRFGCKKVLLDHGVLLERCANTGRTTVAGDTNIMVSPNNSPARRWPLLHPLALRTPHKEKLPIRHEL